MDVEGHRVPLHIIVHSLFLPLCPKGTSYLQLRSRHADTATGHSATRLKAYFWVNRVPIFISLNLPTYEDTDVRRKTNFSHCYIVLLEGDKKVPV